ncbi:thiolase family protein [Bosea sp. (in: a-proteobacteria)]|uniref:thiolase family protein n=1 Tax=Bosea sp. (in: a-proteobacteria) TaxID=1871050 RepID=UPI00262ADBA5|nr:thiolase family protein [Bosea sp. (in: a-proteobacteria)]MCO5089646.1 thiolase family protein [Bosea sp. (in: a-proteobacteria)]
MTEIVLAGGMRTPFGDFGKSLREVPLVELGAHAARASLAQAGLAAEAVDHLVWGNVLPVDQEGYLAARAVALKAGLSESSTAMNVNRACGSGLQAVFTAAEHIASGHSSIALAGGGENFSRAPHIVTGARWGVKRGPQTMVDALDWTYRDPLSLELMGETAENLAEDYKYTREAMDAYALTSQRRAGAAVESGFLARQIAPIEVPDGKASRVFERDEFPRPSITADKIASMKPVFRSGGKVTPANSSGVTDGAAFIVVAERRAAEAAGVRPRARIVDYAIAGVPPRIMGCGPVPATRKLLERQGLRISDVDYFEVNEAFAAVNLHAEAQLGTPRDLTNLYGGGISIGHPPGATGVRMAITALQHLEDAGGRRAILTLCMGGGQGLSVLIERIA